MPGSRLQLEEGEGGRIKEGPLSGKSSTGGEEGQGVEDHVESFLSTIEILEWIAPSDENQPHGRNQPRKASRANTRAPAPPFPHRQPSPRVLDLIVKEPMILTSPVGSILASLSAILHSFPSLSHPSHEIAGGRRAIDGNTKALEGNLDLWSMVDRCPELLCSSPSAVEGSCARLSFVLRKSKAWSHVLPKVGVEI